MKDFTAGHIPTAAARGIFRLLNGKLGTKNVRFYPGLSYRNLLVMKDDKRGLLAKLKTTPPHDITGKKIGGYLPRGKGAECLIGMMNESEVLLHGSRTRASLIWPWGQGTAPRMPAFRQRYKRRAAVITAVHLLKGLGKILGMEVINVPGATGYLDTNYLGKAEYALRALKNNDVVFLHVEAPDEAGHEGNIKHKIKAIEDFDKLVVGTVVRRLKRDIRLLVLPDHPTPIALMTHTAEAVPFVVYPSAICEPLAVRAFNEKEIKKSKHKIIKGDELLGKFLGGKL